MMQNGILADGFLWFCGSTILQIVKCGLKMRHNQVTMEFEILSQAQGQNCLLIYANIVPLKCVELHLLILEKFGTVNPIR